MLIFPLKKEWYEKIKSGEKTIEYREVKPYWSKRVATNLFRPMFGLYSPKKVFDIVSTLGFAVSFSPNPEYLCELRLGYSKKPKMNIQNCLKNGLLM